MDSFFGEEHHLTSRVSVLPQYFALVFGSVYCCHARGISNDSKNWPALGLGRSDNPLRSGSEYTTFPVFLLRLGMISSARVHGGVGSEVGGKG